MAVAEEMAREVGPSGIKVAYERFGDSLAPPVLLMVGGGAQMINWPDGFCARLVSRGHIDWQVRAFRVVDPPSSSSTRQPWPTGRDVPAPTSSSALRCRSAPEVPDGP
jgi:hypothetical protein